MTYSYLRLFFMLCDCMLTLTLNVVLYPNTKTFGRRQNSFLFDTIALHYLYNNAVSSCILYVGNYQITYET